MEYAVLTYITTRMRRGRAKIDVEEMARSLGVPEEKIYEALQALQRRRLISYRATGEPVSLGERVAEYVGRIDMLYERRPGDPLSEIASRYRVIDRKYRELSRLIGDQGVLGGAGEEIEGVIHEIDELNQAIIPYRLRLHRVLEALEPGEPLARYMVLAEKGAGPGRLMDLLYRALLSHQEVIYMAYPLIRRLVVRRDLSRPVGIVDHIYVVRLEQYDRLLGEQDQRRMVMRRIYETGLVDRYLVLRQLVYIHSDIGLLRMLRDRIAALQGDLA